MMAFEDRDTSVQRQVGDASIVEEVILRRNSENPTGPPRIIVTKLVTVDGHAQRVSKRVPQTVIDTNWPGTARNLKNWLLLLIDSATE